MNARVLEQTTELQQSRESSELARPPDAAQAPELTRPPAKEAEVPPGPAAEGKQSGVSHVGEVIHGAIQGTVAAMAMSGMRTLTVELGLLDQPPPEAVMKQKAKAVVAPMPPGSRKAAIELAHWGYGAVGGAAFSLLPKAIRRSAWFGPVYGMVLWAAYEAVIAPGLGLRRRPGAKLSERAALAADHLLYGFILSETRKRPQR